MFLGLPADPDLLEVWIRILPFSHKDGEQTEIMLAKLNFNTKFYQKLIFNAEDYMHESKL